MLRIIEQENRATAPPSAGGEMPPKDGGSIMGVGAALQHDNVSTNAKLEDINTDDEADDAEYDNWKLRELKRRKRDKVIYNIYIINIYGVMTYKSDCTGTLARSDEKKKTVFLDRVFFLQKKNMFFFLFKKKHKCFVLNKIFFFLLFFQKKKTQMFFWIASLGPLGVSFVVLLATINMYSPQKYVVYIITKFFKFTVLIINISLIIKPFNSLEEV